MTTMDIAFRFQGVLAPDQIEKLARVPDVYGIRKLRIAEDSGEIAIEYDATRLTPARVAALIRACGVSAELLTPAMAG